jgi:thiamine kinase-like enzyme
VLSKLKYSDTQAHSYEESEQKELIYSLNSLFAGNLAGVRFVPGGTSVLCFKADLNGQPRFFKTHAIASRRRALQREAAFLEATAAKQTDPHLLHIAEGGVERVWLHTKLLEPCGSRSPLEILTLIARYKLELAKHPEIALRVSSSDSIYYLLSEAESALDCMVQETLLSLRVIKSAHSAIDRLKSVCTDFPLQLCHGDLGPANIMFGDRQLVAIDFEDAFWGIDGFDYLYWLTFFENRKYLGTDALGHTALDRDSEIGLMLILVLLKSWISVRDGCYVQNAMAIDDRLLEVINLY